ncbi:MAG: DUF1232 domain-containing protein [Pseudomonadota bacterium]|nr:DUF1232 domain-containing protein [Pseudomonadota bacterium]
MENSGSFRKAKAEAQRLAQDGRQDEVKRLADKAQAKANKEKGRIHELWDEINTMIEMIKAVSSGRFKLDTKMYVTLIAVVLYFIMPFDIIPDFLVGLGFVDDLAVLGWGIVRLRTHLDDFRVWQAQNPQEPKT